MIRSSTLWIVATMLVAIAGCSSGERDIPVATGAASVCRGYALDGAGGVRLFAVEPRVEPRQLESYEAFRAPLVGLVDRAIRPCLTEDHPNIVVFPDGVGLQALFVGTRGAEARAAATSAEALEALAEPYAAPMAYYAAAFPELEPSRRLLLALTDTSWRAFYETMRDLATSNGSWVIASIVTSGVVEESTDPADIEALADPDLDTRSVYVARDPNVYATAFVFSPSGEIAAHARKRHLTALESDRLFVAPAPAADFATVDVGTARLGILVGNDARMPDLVDRFDAVGANVLVQPAALAGGWALALEGVDWPPGAFQQGAWAATQKHGGLRAAVVPTLTGTLFDVSFDGQAAVIVDASPGDRRYAYVGEEPQSGFASVAPWVSPDPGIADTALSLDARRAALSLIGSELLPEGSRENGYVETVVAADVDLETSHAAESAGPPGALGASAAVAPSGAGEQSHPALAADGVGRVHVVWQDDSEGTPRIWSAVSTDGGRTIGAASPVMPSSRAQVTPAVALGPSAVFVAWVERAGDRSIVRVARSLDHGATFSPATTPGEASETPNEWSPAMAVTDAGPVVAFIGSVDGEERVLVARSADQGTTWAVTAPAGAPSQASPNVRNQQWSPALATRGLDVAVAWVDFQQESWDVLSARSADGGATFGAVTRIDDGGDAPERLHDDPRLLFTAAGDLFASWSDVRPGPAHATARVARGDPSGWSASVVLGAASDDAAAWRPDLAPVGDGVVVVWQDDQSRGNDIHIAMSADGHADFGPARRIDDGGSGTVQQFAPRVALAQSDRLVVVWEDTRAGRRQIRWAAGATAP